MKAFFLAAFVAGACIASAASTCLGADKDELQGEWVATSGEMDGKQLPASEIMGLRLTFKGDTVLSLHPNKNGGKPHEGTYKADSQKSPKQLTIKIVRKTLHGIYEVKGDELKVCNE